MRKIKSGECSRGFLEGFGNVVSQYAWRQHRDHLLGTSGIMFEQRHVNLTVEPLTASLATRISARRNSSCPLVVTKNTVFDPPARYVRVNLRLTAKMEEELSMWLKAACTYSGGFK